MKGKAGLRYHKAESMKMASSCWCDAHPPKLIYAGVSQDPHSGPWSMCLGPQVCADGLWIICRWRRLQLSLPRYWTTKDGVSVWFFLGGGQGRERGGSKALALSWHRQAQPGLEGCSTEHLHPQTHPQTVFAAVSTLRRSSEAASLRGTRWFWQVVAGTLLADRSDFKPNPPSYCRVAFSESRKFSKLSFLICSVATDTTAQSGMFKSEREQTLVV